MYVSYCRIRRYSYASLSRRLSTILTRYYHLEAIDVVFTRVLNREMQKKAVKCKDILYMTAIAACFIGLDSTSAAHIRNHYIMTWRRRISGRCHVNVIALDTGAPTGTTLHIIQATGFVTL